MRRWLRPGRARCARGQQEGSRTGRGEAGNKVLVGQIVIRDRSIRRWTFSPRGRNRRSASRGGRPTTSGPGWGGRICIVHGRDGQSEPRGTANRWCDPRMPALVVAYITTRVEHVARSPPRATRPLGLALAQVWWRAGAPPPGAGASRPVCAVA